MSADRWGIEDGWWDHQQQWRPANPDSIEHVRSALAAARDQGRHDGSPSWFLRAGSTMVLEGRGELVLEDGTTRGVDGLIPGDLPIGHHQLHLAGRDQPVRLVVAPHRAPGLGPRRWGVTVQLFSLHSATSRGIGDLADLEAAGSWLASRGGSVLAVNPLCDVLPLTPRQASPYTPSSRRHLDPIWLDIGEPTEAGGLIDRDAVWASKRATLAATVSPREPATVDRHAVFNALVEAFGTGWRRWPAQYQQPDHPEVDRFAREHPAAVAFWAEADAALEARLAHVRERLRDAGVELMGDLPVGVDPEGYDTWIDQDVVLQGVRIGAPPDPFSPDGQNWALPAFDPVALRASGYRAFIDVLRANLGRVDGLRIDHVMGWFRLYLIPDGADPADGVYLRYRADELLDLAVLEATRAGAYLVGEDLGTVEPGVSETLAARGIAGTRLALFDPHPDRWPAASLGAISTHDLPTFEGVMSSRDPTADLSLRETLTTFAGGRDGLVAAHRALADAGSDLVLASMEDVVGSPQRVNLPGTTDSAPNWKVPLPATIEELEDHPIAREVTAVMAQARPRS